MYRRDMKVIGCLGALDRHGGVPVPTRNWNTVTAIARVIAAGKAREGRRGRRSPKAWGVQYSA
jgi:hypothetical protein